MKKSFAIILMLITFPFSAYSQIINSFGAKIGTAISSPIWDKASQNDSRVQTMYGFDVGGFIKINLYKNISVIPEIHYLKKGFKYDLPITTLQHPNGTGEFYTINSSANYLSLPLNISWEFYKSYFDAYVFGGSRFDFVIEKYGNEWQYYYERFKDFDFGFCVGLGIQTRELINIGTGLEFRFSPNITKSYTDGYEQITNRSFEILFVIYN